MKKLLQLTFVLFTLNLAAQLPNGAIAPNFKATDINGNEHNLYDILAEGKDVIIDFSATWCGPCWAFHGTHALEDLYNAAGPDGDNSAMVFYVECDVTTTMDDLLGNTAASQGDWITGTSYPILDNSGIASAYQIGAYPTIIKVCADRKVQIMGRLTGEGYEADLATCPSVEYGSEPFFFADNYVGCGSTDVQFLDDSWPRPTSWAWDFGDGNTSDEQSPMHTYAESGDYSVTLEVTNAFGSNQVIKEELISIGEGSLYDSQSVGPLNKDIGSGRYFEGGHQALIFNTWKDVVIESATVFSDKEGDRTIVLLDSNGELVSSKVVYVPEGEHRIDIDFFVPVGLDWNLGMRSDAFLFRNDGGTNYPYEIEGMLTIDRSTAGSSVAEARQYYYYFYDWAVRDAGCQDGTSVDDLNDINFTLFPNPASSELTVKGEGIVLRDVRLLDVLGNNISVAKKQKVNQVLLDVNALESGMYLINVGDSVKKFYKN